MKVGQVTTITRRIGQDLSGGYLQGLVQGTIGNGKFAVGLMPEMAEFVNPIPTPRYSDDPTTNQQLIDILIRKIPRALRFNDRVSMMYGTELRVPFLDHRLVEFGLRQPIDRKIRNGLGKVFVRQAVSGFIPNSISQAPKRPLQTPQREWLGGKLATWAEDMIETGLKEWGGIWLDLDKVRQEWHEYKSGARGSSFHIWQWISLGLTKWNVERVA